MRIIEKGGDFGGTWYWNRYPGAQCDTASMIYMPLLEETGHMPTEKYAHAPEIRNHCSRIGETFGLYDKALFHTEVTGLEWNEDAKVWTVHTNRGDAFRALLGTVAMSFLDLCRRRQRKLGDASSGDRVDDGEMVAVLAGAPAAVDERFEVCFISHAAPDRRALMRLQRAARRGEKETAR